MHIPTPDLTNDWMEQRKYFSVSQSVWSKKFLNNVWYISRKCRLIKGTFKMACAQVSENLVQAETNARAPATRFSLS